MTEEQRLETMSLHNLESIDKSSILEPVLLTAEYPLKSANRQKNKFASGYGVMLNG